MSDQEKIKNAYLHLAMKEYSALIYDEKVKYMNILTEWYMREKDLLNMLSNKPKN